MEIKLDNIDFFYINLSNREDRNSHILLELDKINISAKRFEALTKQDNFLNFELPELMNDGNKGCALSHIKILEDSKNSDKIIGIFEDDAVFCEDFIERFKYIEENFDKDWDIFFLSSFYHLNDDKNFKWKEIEFEFTDVKYIHRVYSSFTTHSYLVNPKSINKILDLIYSEIQNAYAIDHLYILIQDKLNCFSFTPGMTMQYSNISDISNDFKSQESFAEKLGEHVYAKNIKDFNYDKYFNLKKEISNEIMKYYFRNNDFQYTIYNFDYFTKIYGINSERNIAEILQYNLMMNIVNKLDKDRKIIDVGGNCGLFCIPASLYGYKVYSFEPISMNNELLLLGKNENNCENLEIVNVALSDKNESKNIYIPYCSDNTSFNKEVAISNMSNKNYVVEKVKCISFDTWLSENKVENIGFIKIDVQGFEKNVIDGMFNFLNNCSDVFLLIEWDQNHTEKSGHNLKDIYDTLISLNFEEVGYESTEDKLFYKK